MLHVVARTQHHRLAFHTWEEGRRLWDTVVQASPGLVAMVVMPDHVHVLVPVDTRERLGRALGGYTRWRNHRRGEHGVLWQRLPEPDAVEGQLKLQRSIRYIHLNPCRAGLVQDPLAWPLTTHADAVGLSLAPVRRRATDAHAFHRYVSGDPSVRPEGTDLPAGMAHAPSADEVLQAVSAAGRWPLSTLRRNIAARRFAVRAMRTLSAATAAEIGAQLQVSRYTVGRVRPGVDAQVRVVERWLGDPRATPMHDAVLAHLLSRSRYRGAARR